MTQRVNLSDSKNRTDNRGRWSLAAEFGLIFACALLTALFGILTRPSDGLALFWPANALLLGLFLRWPKFAEAHGWIAATAGLFAADTLTGNSFLVTLWLTSSNMLGIAAGYLLFLTLPIVRDPLQRPSDMVGLLIASGGAAIAGATVGAGSAPIILGQPSLTGFGLWSSNELLNFIVILPVILTLPAVTQWSLPQWRNAISLKKASRLLPLAVLGLSILLGVQSGSPLVVTLSPFPALIWCAMRYNLFSISVIVLLICLWLMTFVWSGVLDPTNLAHVDRIIMTRLLVMALMLAVLLTSTMRAKRQVPVSPT